MSPHGRPKGESRSAQHEGTRVSAGHGPFDVIVIGLGAMGAATAWQLARRGARVLGLDSHAPPHAMGSSHGATRITRLAVGEGPEYVPLVRRSHAIWRELESDGAAGLYDAVGGLVLGHGAHRSTLHGQGDFVARTIAIAHQFGIDHEVLDSQALRQRFPQLGVSDGEQGYFESEAGLLRPELCVQAQLVRAAALGAKLMTKQVVTHIERQGDSVVVHTATARYTAAQAVLAAGNWTPALAGAPYDCALRVHRQVLHWFAAERPADYAPGRFPVFIWAHGPQAEDAFYGFPIADAHGGVKVATQQYAVACAPDELVRSSPPVEAATMHASHVQGRLRGVTAQRVHAAVCAYTVAPDSRFVIEAHPRIPALVVVSACSGHGFKHSAALGEALAQRLTAGTSAIDLSAFALAAAPAAARQGASGAMPSA